jgi:hypothetical protein
MKFSNRRRPRLFLRHRGPRQENGGFPHRRPPLQIQPLEETNLPRHPQQPVQLQIHVFGGDSSGVERQFGVPSEETDPTTRRHLSSLPRLQSDQLCTPHRPLQSAK